MMQYTDDILKKKRYKSTNWQNTWGRSARLIQTTRTGQSLRTWCAIALYGDSSILIRSKRKLHVKFDARKDGPVTDNAAKAEMFWDFVDAALVEKRNDIMKTVSASCDSIDARVLEVEIGASMHR